jgi:hypothetical protein
MWLGTTRGYLTDWVTQQWVKITGKKIDIDAHPWLAGPIGKPTGIGANFFEQLAAEQSLLIKPGVGLMADFAQLGGESCDCQTVSPSVIHFYEHTAEYELEAWSEWCGAFKPFGWALARIFSRRLQQLNVPLSGLDTSQGITSDVINLLDAAGRVRYVAWLRRLRGNQNVLYAGCYSLCSVPGSSGMCVKIVFPLPNGNAVVIMYPRSSSDSSFSLVSSGRGFGAPGFYFTVHGPNGVWARYVRAMRETISVYADRSGEVRANHVLRFCGIVFLRLHYRLRHARPDIGFDRSVCPKSARAVP